MGVRADGAYETDGQWPVTLDVMPRFKQAKNYSGRAVTSMALRFAGGGSGLLAELDIDQRVCLVVDAVVKSHGHNQVKSDKTTVFQLTHTLTPAGVYVVELDRGGLELIAACQGAHAQQFSTHGGELQGLDI